jgi:nitrogen regulatory protein PII
VFRGTEFQVDSLPEIKIELMLQDSQKNAVIAAITKATKTLKSDGARIFVSHVDDAVRSGMEALEGQLA